MNNRIDGYDVIRSFAIVVVFLGHILIKQSTNETILLLMRSLSPGLTMSLLGFISAVLISSRNYGVSSFLIKRFTRIFISLWLCLIVIICAHLILGEKNVFTQHTLLHFMGLSAFFELFQVENKSTVGAGLWFITIINLMYLVFPLLQKLFQHYRGLTHLLIFISLCTVLNFVMYGTSSTWNVVISFSVGVYLAGNGYIDRLVEFRCNYLFPLLGCALLLTISALSTSLVIPCEINGALYAFYPVAFTPLLFAIQKKLPTQITKVIRFFSSISYEFYILHFYLINDHYNNYFSASIPLYGQILISFVTTLFLSYIISEGASWSRTVANKYLLGSMRIEQRVL